MPTTTTGIATTFIDFTRASNATVTDSDGKVKWAPHNLLTNSESFDAAAWGKYLATVSANTQAAPNGTTTADTVTASAGNDVHRLQRASDVAIGASANASLSIFVKAGTHNFVTIGFYSATEVFVSATFNLASGSAATETDVGTTSGTVVSTEKVDVGTGWYRLTITGNYSGSSALSFVNFAQAATGNSYTNFGQPVANLVGTETFHLWGAHLYRSDLGGMQPNTSAYPMYNPTTPKNLLGYTEDFSAAAWTKSGLAATPVIANTVVAPNGLQTADKIVENSSASTHLVAQSAGALLASPYVASVYAKAAERSFVSVGFDGLNAWFNLSTGAVGTVESGLTATITSVGNGWYRCAVYRTVAVAATKSFGVYVTTADNVVSYTGDGTSGIYLWGAQLSASASLDPYVPVYGAAVTSAAYYGPRRDFDGATLACKGLLVEEQRTNLRVNSATSVSSIPGTVLSTGNSSPDGANAANGFTEDTSAVERTVGGFNFSQNQTLSFFVSRTAGSSTRYIAILAVNVAAGGAFFNLAAGTAVTNSSSDFTATITPIGSYWRCSVTRVNATGQDLQLFITEVNTPYSGSKSYTGDGVSKFLFWGFQLEAGSFATSYIPTGAATATRNADVASVSTQAFPYSSTESSIVVAYSIIANKNGTGVSSQYLGSLNAGSNERIDMIAQGGGNGPLFYTIVGGSTVVTLSGASTTVQVNTPWKVGAAIKNADYAASRNGSTPTTVTTAGAMPAAATELGIGAATFGAQLNGHIRQITYLPRRISNTELQTRTA